MRRARPGHSRRRPPSAGASRRRAARRRGDRVSRKRARRGRLLPGRRGGERLRNVAHAPMVAAPGPRIARDIRVAMLLTWCSFPEVEKRWHPRPPPPRRLRTVVLAAGHPLDRRVRGAARAHGATRSAFLSAAFFIALLTAARCFYGRLAYTVSDSGLTVRTFSAVRHFSSTTSCASKCCPTCSAQLRGADAARAAPVLEPARRARAPLPSDRAARGLSEDGGRRAAGRFRASQLAALALATTVDAAAAAAST